MITAYTPDRSLLGKVRRRITRLLYQRKAALTFDGPVVSFTFDDIPASAAHTGATILEEAGLRGTFYVCAGLFGRMGHMGRFADAEDISGLIRRGHEVAGHTLNHIDCHRTSEAALEVDLDTNDQILARLGASTDHFAYPYGEVSPRSKRLMAQRYASMRGVHKGLVRQGSDLNQLPGVGIEGPDGEEIAKGWIDRAVAEKAWLILYTHDVQDTPSAWGCRPDGLRRLIAYAADKGAQILPLGAVVGQ
jgi:peptidoglycan/xylan/chitin deacetylase (PgdA/CDA1 family)